MNILISAGPTREHIDPVRFISNRSSGKMGYALAIAAEKLKHNVTLVSGPVNLPAPPNINLICVESALEMFNAIKDKARQMDIIIMAAAVADYRPITQHQQKIKKNDDALILKLERTDDILANLGKHKTDNQILVGFAAETNNLLAYAQGKLESKNLDWIIANDISQQGIGFNSDQNAVTMISKSGNKIELPQSSKLDIANQIINTIVSETN